MKVDNAGNATGIYSPQGKSAKRQIDSSTGSTESSDSGSGENVAINPLASQISAVSQQIGSEPSFDMAKVTSIQNAIASGQFQINPANIADGLISSTKALLAG